METSPIGLSVLPGHCGSLVTAGYQHFVSQIQNTCIWRNTSDKSSGVCNTWSSVFVIDGQNIISEQVGLGNNLKLSF